jgi:histidine triad (HIT) family protein
MYDQQNIFARILRGEIPCKKIYEDSFVLAFYDIFPKAPVHILVIPKSAYTDIVDFGARASTDEIEGFFRAVSKIAAENNLSQNGFRSIANTGIHGGQEVPHFHIHLLGGKPIGPMVSSD